MTNKLPVAGKRYRRIGEGYEIVVEEVTQSYAYLQVDGEICRESLLSFWKYFEEIK